MIRLVSILSPVSGIADRFALILGGLCDAIAACMSKPRTVRQQAAFPLLMLLWSRLRRSIARFSALAAGAPPPLPRTRNRTGAVTRTTPTIKNLPQGIGWVIRLLPEANCFRSQLEYMLGEADMAAFLKSSPQALRLLRPLCRMLAIPEPKADPPPIKSAKTDSPPPVVASPSLPTPDPATPDLSMPDLPKSNLLMPDLPRPSEAAADPPGPLIFNPA